MCIGVAGLVLGIIGLAAMWFPIYLDQFDSYGIQVSCGNGLGPHLPGEGGAALESRCGTAVLIRRAWAIAAIGTGWLLVTWFVLRWTHTQRQDDAEPFHTVPHPELGGFA